MIVPSRSRRIPGREDEPRVEHLDLVLRADNVFGCVSPQRDEPAGAVLPRAAVAAVTASPHLLRSRKDLPVRAYEHPVGSRDTTTPEAAFAMAVDHHLGECADVASRGRSVAGLDGARLGCPINSQVSAWLVIHRTTSRRSARAAWVRVLWRGLQWLLRNGTPVTFGRFSAEVTTIRLAWLGSPPT
jgi:hypothetical protein